MSMKHLGERFDIHTGGNDNKFPHHEDEIAQSEGAVGHQVVSIWVHGGLPPDGRPEDVQVRQEHQPGDRSGRARASIRSRTGCCASAPATGARWTFSWEALEGVHRRLDELRRRMAEWAPGASTRRTRRRATTRGSGRRWPTTSTCPRALVVMNEAGLLRPPERREVRAARVLGRRARPGSRTRGDERMGADRRDARADGRARRGPWREGLRRRRTSSATASKRWVSRSWTRPKAPRSEPAISDSRLHPGLRSPT